MMRSSSSPWRAFAAAVSGLAILALGLGACAKRLTEVDPSFVHPEGKSSPNAQMILWYEAPVPVQFYRDIGGHLGPEEDPQCVARRLVDPVDGHVIATENHAFGPAGAIDLMIFDRTPATAYRPMRREANGGYRAVIDYALAPARKWLESEWESYRFQDTRPSGHNPPTYLARGLVGGTESASSPLTNEAHLSDATIGDVAYTGRCLPCDSLFTLRWNPIAGAARVWLHVYQLNGDANPDEILKSTQPSPVNLVKSQDFLIASLPGNATSYKLGDRARTDIERVVERRTNFGQTYRVRVSAVDSTGRLIATTSGDYGVVDRGEQYGLFRLGAYLVTTKRPGPNFPFCQTDP